MDDIAFNIPKRILGFLVVTALVIACMYGLFTWDSRKASELFTKELLLIATPIANYAQKRMERVVESALGVMKGEAEPAAQ